MLCYKFYIINIYIYIYIKTKPLTFMKRYRNIADVQLTRNVLCFAHRIKYRAL